MVKTRATLALLIVAALLSLTAGTAHAGAPQQTGTRCGEVTYWDGEYWQWVCLDPPSPIWGFWARYKGEEQEYGYAVGRAARWAYNFGYISQGWWTPFLVNTAPYGWNYAPQTNLQPLTYVPTWWDLNWWWCC